MLEAIFTHLAVQLGFLGRNVVIAINKSRNRTQSRAATLGVQGVIAMYLLFNTLMLHVFNVVSFLDRWFVGGGLFDFYFFLKN